MFVAAAAAAAGCTTTPYAGVEAGNDDAGDGATAGAGVVVVEVVAAVVAVVIVVVVVDAGVVGDSCPTPTAVAGATVVLGGNFGDVGDVDAVANIINTSFEMNSRRNNMTIVQNIQNTDQATTTLATYDPTSRREQGAQAVGIDYDVATEVH